MSLPNVFGPESWRDSRNCDGDTANPCHREGVDSLFDATLFDATPEPSVAPEVGEGQLDIFGNVVSKPTEPSSDREAHVTETFLSEGGPIPGAESQDVPVGYTESTADPDDPADPDVVDDTGDFDDTDRDPGDVLNDPNWEPPIDIDESIAILDETPERGPSVDALWDDVVGQPAAVDLLRAAAISPVHAYLFVGPPGSGRAVAARSFASALLCPSGGCATCSTCVRSLAGQHPDLVEVERDGASITVDQAREIIRLAMRSPLEGNRKVIVLVDFHLVANAAPTLLKIIEEPPPSTVFVVLADQLTNELVTIASRCLQVRFTPLSLSTITESLVRSGGVERDLAERVAKASGGRLDRARLLVHDPHFQSRLEFWGSVTRRVDGTGASAAVLVAEALAMIDGAASEPLEKRHLQEQAALEERLEATGVRGGAGLKKELLDRQKREVKRLRDDELRFGLGVLQQTYRNSLRDVGPTPSAVEAITTLGRCVDELIRNPNVTLLLSALFLKLPTLRH